MWIVVGIDIAPAENRNRQQPDAVSHRFLSPLWPFQRARPFKSPSRSHTQHVAEFKFLNRHWRCHLSRPPPPTHPTNTCHKRNAYQCPAVGQWTQRQIRGVWLNGTKGKRVTATETVKQSDEVGGVKRENKWVQKYIFFCTLTCAWGVGSVGFCT